MTKKLAPRTPVTPQQYREFSARPDFPDDVLGLAGDALEEWRGKGEKADLVLSHRPNDYHLDKGELRKLFLLP
jgi:hypothetical protein